MTIPRFLTQAMKLLEEAENEPRLNYRLAAVVVRGGSVIGTGLNFYDCKSWATKMSSVAIRGGAVPKNSKYVNTHAEMAAVYDAVKKTGDVAGAKIYVARLSKSGEFASAKPCEVCQAILYRYGVRKAVFSIDASYYGCIRIKKGGCFTEEKRLVKEIKP